MKFHFEFDIKKIAEPISHKHKLFLMGSCFTENIGEKLKKYKFSVLENPNGILFNPVSVAEALTSYINNTQYTEADLFEWNEGWHSWKHHSRFSALTATEALVKINDSTSAANHYLKEADYLMITLGSSWTYTLTNKAANAKPGAVAANNHKAPADWFSKKLMSSQEVSEVLENMLLHLFAFNPKLKVMFTISPVRHLREGVVENKENLFNKLSKSDNPYFGRLGRKVGNEKFIQAAQEVG